MGRFLQVEIVSMWFGLNVTTCILILYAWLFSHLLQIINLSFVSLLPLSYLLSWMHNHFSPLSTLSSPCFRTLAGHQCGHIGQHHQPLEAVPQGSHGRGGQASGRHAEVGKGRRGPVVFSCISLGLLVSLVLCNAILSDVLCGHLLPF